MSDLLGATYIESATGTMWDVHDLILEAGGRDYPPRVVGYVLMSEEGLIRSVSALWLCWYYERLVKA